MSRNQKLIWLSVILAGWLGAGRPARAQGTHDGKSADRVTQRRVNVANLPLVFEPNLGQADRRVRFLTRAAGMTSFLSDGENVMVLSKREHKRSPGEAHETSEVQHAVVRMKLDGAGSSSSSYEGLEKTAAIANYLVGNDPSKWVTNIPVYRQVRGSGVYPGIDLIYYGDGRKLEYDFRVRPGADPNQIRLTYDGAKTLTTDTEGNLRIATPLGTLLQRKPVVYQEINGKRDVLQASYSIHGKIVQFRLSAWDRSRELVIDPVLEYSTFLADGGNDSASSIAVDSSGAAYVTGSTTSATFPVVSPFQGTYAGNGDAFVTKLNAAGTDLVYSTYLGGNGNDEGASIAVDSTGAAYVAGSTTSNNFPTTPGAPQGAYGGSTDAFAVKLNAAGNSLAYSTYLGGTGSDLGTGIALNAGDAYVTGYTQSTNFPTTPGAFQTANRGGTDAFVVQLNPDGTALRYSTYLGGDSYDQSNGIAVDSSGAAYVAGFTESSFNPSGKFPVTAGAYQTTFQDGTSDAFITKLNSTGSALVYATYLGGFSNDHANAIAIDTEGAAYVTGFTQSSNFPFTSGPGYFGGSDAFVTKLNATGSALVYSMVIGGGGNDQGNAIAVNAAGAALIGGFENSSNFPVTACAFQTTPNGTQDGFLTEVNPPGTALANSTLLGGHSTDAINGIALDSAGAAYVTGTTASVDFPTTSNSYQPTFAGGATTSFVSKLNVTAAGGAPAVITATSGTPQSAAVSAAFALPLVATVTDASGNPVNGVTVTFAAPTAGATATLSSATATTGCDGTASVTATANTVVGTYAVTATAPGITTPATFALTNAGGGAATIAFVQQPTDTQAGSPISPAVSVSLQDAFGNPIAGVPLTLSIQGGSATLNGTVTQTTDATGVATFPGLNITTAGTYQLQAMDGGLTTLSNAFNITAAGAVSIATLGGRSQAVTVGTAFPAPLRAVVQDSFGNVIPNASVTFTAPSGGATATFGGPTTVTTDANGIATSPILTASNVAGTFQVTATTPGAPTPAVFPLNIAAGTADQLVFVQQPSDTPAGTSIAPAVTVQLEDSFGNVVRMPGVAITLQLTPQQTLSGTATQETDANGVATFADLSIAQAGTYQLLASDGGTASATSNSFQIVASSATAIAATGGTPQSAVIQTGYGAALQALVTDATGNPVAAMPVVFSAPNAGPSGVFSGQSTTTVNTDDQGRATAMITANDVSGMFGATASSAGVTGSAVFDLTNLPQGSSSLAFVQQPSNTVSGQAITPPVTVQVRDASGNPILVSGIPVALSLASGTGALSGTLVQLTDANGVATFNDLRIDLVGTKTLRAISPNQSPAESQPFQIITGPPANITVFSGSPQAANVLQPFPILLQALVTDAAGNPVSGANVTFLIPTSGPSGVFAGTVTVATNANGVATAPALTANNQPGDFTVTATTTGLATPALFALTNLPQQPSAVIMNPTTLSFASETGQPAPPAQTVQISASGTVTWTTASSAPWLTAAPASGAGSAPITVSVNPAGLAPGTYSGSIRITDSTGGVSVVAVTYTVTNKPALVITPPALVFFASSNTITLSPQTLTATSSGRRIAYSVSATVSTPAGGNWLQISTTQGQTIGTVAVTARPAGLANGAYDGSVLFTPTDNTLNAVAVPVTLVVGCGQGGCLIRPTIFAVVNGASFRPGGAPRAIMTIFGRNLSDAVYQATSYPLPTQLGPTSVTVNGAPVPLFYASPTQINFQMPSNAPVSTVQVVVNNDALANTSRALPNSLPHATTLTVVQPGLFINNPGRRAAALNVDLSPHTAATPIPAGGFVLLFLTGEGPITPPIPDGTAAPGNPLSLIDARVQVTIGGKPAQVTYQGVAPGFAGLDQINAIVPSGLAPGNQPVFVTVNGLPSNVGLITVQ